MLKKITFILVVPCCCLFSAEKVDKDIDHGKPYSSEEIFYNITKGIALSAAAGYCAAGGNIPGAIVGIMGSSENFLEAGDKAYENIQYENNRDPECNDRENDHDSWDHDF